MNKYLVGVAVVSTCAMSALAGLDGAAYINSSPFSFGSGGEFTVTPDSGYVGQTGLPADLNGTSFQSFCMERDEVFSPGGLYGVCINTSAVGGGNGGSSYPVTPETALLYWNFRMGTLPAMLFDYGAGRQASAGDLQAAIWFLQGNQAGGANNALAVWATTTVGLGGGLGGVGNIGDVRALNVYNGDGSRAQDQLTIVPTPGAAALAGVGLLASARRRRV